MSGDWVAALMGDVAHVEMGQSPPSDHVSEDADTGLAFLQGNAEFTDLHPRPRLRCRKPLKIAEAHDTLISVRAPVGAINRADQPYCIGRGLAAVRFHGADPGFGFQALALRARTLRRVAQGTTFEAIGGRELRALEFPLPPLPEQRRIAEILDTVDEAIRKTEEVIAKLQQMKQGLLHDLLTRGIDENGELRDPERHPEQFKDSPLGRIPRGWEVRPLGSVAEVLNGTTPSRERRDYWQDGTVGWLSSTRVNDYRVTAPSEWISAKALAECSLRVLPVGTVVVGMIGQGRTRGMAARLEIEATINQNLAAVVPGPYLHPLFLHIYLHSRYEALRSGGRGSNQDALNCSLVSAFPAPVPGFVEQERVATAFGELEARMIKEWESVRKLRLLKQGLMDDLLTGRVRVKVPTEER